MKFNVIRSRNNVYNCIYFNIDMKYQPILPYMDTTTSLTSVHTFRVFNIFSIFLYFVRIPIVLRSLWRNNSNFLKNQITIKPAGLIAFNRIIGQRFTSVSDNVYSKMNDLRIVNSLIISYTTFEPTMREIRIITKSSS